MIFITVGTEKYPFDRLVEEVDRLKEKRIINEDVFIQIGSSHYKPKFCEYSDFLPFDQMLEEMKKARIVITHGGPGSIMPVVHSGKVPIVVSRRKKYGEAVDDHQISFIKKLEEKSQIIAAYDLKDLEEKIKNYEDIAQKLKRTEKESFSLDVRVSNFAQALDEICGKLIREEKI